MNLIEILKDSRKKHLLFARKSFLKYGIAFSCDNNNQVHLFNLTEKEVKSWCPSVEDIIAEDWLFVEDEGYLKSFGLIPVKLCF